VYGSDKHASLLPIGNNYFLKSFLARAPSGVKAIPSKKYARDKHTNLFCFRRKKIVSRTLTLDVKTFQICFMKKCQREREQGTLTEREGSVQLNSSLRQVVLKKRKIYFQYKKPADLI
jgi:hypothetical protein